ncbi:MAG: holo-ACP synthase [Nitrososphaerota archaeon]|nr:holo-ACP synthase [Nitrososphaerota archaeon]
MVKGIGVDLVEIKRIADIIDTSGEKFLNKIFTEGEISRSSKRKGGKAEYYSTLFAGKESILKAFGVGWVGAKGTDIEIKRNRLGAPIAELRGGIAKLAKRKGVGEVFLSLSYDSEYAVAFCVLD